MNVWVECLSRDKGALQAFRDYIEGQEGLNAKQSVAYFGGGDIEKSRTYAAMSLAWKSIREQISIFEREEQQNGIIREQGQSG